MPRLTKQTVSLLEAMLEAPTAEWYGLELMGKTGLQSGTVYPALARMEAAGWLCSRWEDVESGEIPRPRRRLYSLTGEGQLVALQGSQPQPSARSQMPSRTDWKPGYRGRPAW